MCIAPCRIVGGEESGAVMGMCGHHRRQLHPNMKQPPPILWRGRRGGRYELRSCVFYWVCLIGITWFHIQFRREQRVTRIWSLCLESNCGICFTDIQRVCLGGAHDDPKEAQMDSQRLSMPTCGSRSFRDVLKGIRAGGTLVEESRPGQDNGPMECRGPLEEEFQEVRPKCKYTRKATCTPQDHGVKVAKRNQPRKMACPVAIAGDECMAVKPTGDVVEETTEFLPAVPTGEQSQGVRATDRESSVAGRGRGRGAHKRSRGRGRAGRGLDSRQQGHMHAAALPEPVGKDATKFILPSIRLRCGSIAYLPRLHARVRLFGARDEGSF